MHRGVARLRSDSGPCSPSATAATDPFPVPASDWSRLRGMSEFTLHAPDPSSQRELDHLCIFAMMTLWESRPEMRVDPKTLPDFGFDSHRRIFEAGLKNPDQRYRIAVDGEANIVGHSVVVVRHDRDVPYGFLWSRYVLPQYRRRGLARQLLHDSLDWLKTQRGPVAYAEVHIHTENQAARRLFERERFTIVDRRTERWPYLVLRHDLM